MPTKTFENLPEDKKKRIKRAALEKFNEKGYDDTTISDIVKVSGIPRGSFYQYFESKFDVFYMLLVDAQMKKLEYFTEIFESEKIEAPFFDLVMEIFDVALKYLRDYPEYSRLGYWMYHSSAFEVLEIVERFDQEGVKNPLHFLKRDQKRGHIRSDIDLKTLARMLFNLFGRELIDMVEKGASDEELIRFAKKHMDILKRGAEN